MDLSKRLSSLLSHRFATPLALLAVTVLAYGLSFWRLGFYWDDQPISWIRYQLGTAATAHYFFDSRPVWAYLYQLTGFILPLKPAYWQLFAMFWRWAGVLSFWLVMDRLFPQRRNLALLLSLLVLLYPGFNQQWVSYVYSHFFIVLFFLLFSWYLMLRGWTLPALVFSALNLVMFEYFFLLEFFRPVILYRSLQAEGYPPREQAMKTLRMWLPYSLPVIFAVAYRSLVYTHPGFGYSLQDELLRAPAAASLDLLGRVLSGLWAAAGAAWLQAFQFPVSEVNGVRTTVLYIVVVAAAGAIAWLLKRSNEAAGNGSRAEARWLLGSGALLLILGGAAFWATNIPVTLSFPANRATLSFMLGACFFLMGLIDLLPAQVRVPAAILLVALSAGRQFLWSVDYMREWDTQKSLFWQMTWRAPGLQPGTMVLLNEGALHFNADNSLSTALNSIYAPDLDYSGSVPYLLFYPTNRLDGSLPFLEPGHAILYNYWAGRFTGSTSQVVSFFYMPPGCLRLLDPVIDRENHFIPDRYLLREGAALSSAEWIETTTSSRMPAIYGPEPAHGWCWYFEKADLARQEGDWQQAAALGDQAFASGDHPNDPSERFVFIESYAHTGDWERAVEVSLESHRVSPKYVDPMLCKLWDRIALQTEGGAERTQAVEKIRTKLACRGE